MWAYFNPGNNNILPPSPLLAVSIGKENLIVCFQLLERELRYFLPERRALCWGTAACGACPPPLQKENQLPDSSRTELTANLSSLCVGGRPAEQQHLSQE